jgi:uncharacterized protein (DUF2141 family)
MTRNSPQTFAARLVASLVFSATAALLAPQAFAQTCATVEVQNVRPNQGFLMLAAFSSADTYNKKPLTSLRVAAGNATMSFQLCGLSGDSVALTLFQDLDSDGKMGQNLLGMPTEPWGASGSPGMFGPQWDTTKVALDGNTIVVKMSQ